MAKKTRIDQSLINQAREKLWRKGNLEWKFSATQKKINDYFKDNKNKILVLSASRRLGKCIKENTLIMTPTGPVKIQELKIGDYVMGYNKDGSVSPTKVIDVIFQGEKPVIDLINRDKVVASSTLDHTWLTKNTRNNTIKELSTRNIVGDFNKIVRKLINLPGVDIDEPHAYVIGALAGDECYLENNSNPEFIEITYKSEPYIAPTWDIEVDNETHLYLLANGLVTHNSHTLITYAIQTCLSGPNKYVKYVLPEQKMARIIIKPLMREILKDCPDDLKPKYNSIDSKYIFANGSEIQLAGSDMGNADRLRGGDGHLCLVDEAGFCDDLNNLVSSVLIPTTLLTGGKIILSSTVPPNPNHPFIDYMNSAGQKDSLIIKTIFDARDDDLTSPNPRITDEMINEIIESYPAGIESPAFQNEYMCKLVYNNNEIVIPEFTQELQDEIITDWIKPPFCLKYISMDIGFSDLTVALLAYYDFDSGVLVIQDEIVMSGPSMTTDKLAQRIKDKEKELWTNDMTGEQEKVYKRVSDNNLIVINDLYRLHGLYFQATQKDNKEMAINNLRMMLSGREIIINPKCKVLIHHLKNTVWNKARTDFRRTQDGAHGDSLMSLVYMVRNLDKGMSPYPPGYSRRKIPYGDRFDKFNEEESKYQGFKDMFKVKKASR